MVDDSKFLYILFNFYQLFYEFTETTTLRRKMAFALSYIGYHRRYYFDVKDKSIAWIKSHISFNSTVQIVNCGYMFNLRYKNRWIAASYHISMFVTFEAINAMLYWESSRGFLRMENKNIWSILSIPALVLICLLFSFQVSWNHLGLIHRAFSGVR